MKAYLLAGAAIVAMLPSIATAQSTDASTAPAPQAQPQSKTGADDDIIITAQRREENLQKVPVAVTVFTSEDRDKRGIRSIQDFANVTPGLTFSATLDRLSLRGVGRLTNIIGSDPGVAVYNDGLYTASNAEASKTPMFVDRVEILRGPQGTLYGRNSVGGSINVISKRPKDFFEGEFRLTVDNKAGLISEGYLSGPIAGGLKGRVSVQMGPIPTGYAFDNIGPAGKSGALKRFLVEGQLQYDFSDRVQLWFKYSHAEWNEAYGSANLITPYATGTPNSAGQFWTATGPVDPTGFYPSGALVPNPGYGYTTPNPGVLDARVRNTNTEDHDRLSNNHNFVVNFKADMGGVTLKYVGGYSQYLYTLYTDLDLTANSKQTGRSAFGAFTYNPTYIQRYVEDKKYYSNEVTLSNSSPGRFNWILGGYQFHEKYFQPIDWYQGGDGTDNMSAALASPVCVDAFYALAATCAANPRKSFYSGSSHLKTDSYAAFGQMDYKITPELKLTIGGRYSSDKKVGDETYRLVNYNPTGSNYCFLPGVNNNIPFYFASCGPAALGVDITRYVLQIAGSGPATRTLSGKWEGGSWRFGLDYQINPTTLLFASYSRGLKAGGFNLGSYAASPEVTTEKVDAYEVGLKSRPAKGFTLNLTGFYYDYRDAQIPITVPLGTTALTTTNFFNIPKTRSYGAEVEAIWNVTPQFELSGTYSYLDAVIRKGPRLFDDPNAPGTVLVDIAGNRTPGASKHKVYLSALYDVPLGADAGNLFFAASYAYRSDAYYDVFQSNSGRAPGWSQVDARITYVDPSKKLTVIFYARNLFDTLGYDGATGYGGTSAAGFGKTYSYTLPRQIGAEMHIKF